MSRIIKNLYFGFIFLLTNITSVIVVTQIMGFNLPLAFAMTGINTLLFFFITKKKLMSVLGISGLYIGAVLIIKESLGAEYALGGVFMVGILYFIYSLIFFKWQKQILNYIPNYLLSTIILLIGINLIPIGVDLVKTDLLVGLSAFFAMLLIEVLAKGKLRLFSMPIGILVGTLAHILMHQGLDLSPLSQNVAMEFIMPKFSLEAFLTISIVSLGVVFEAFGDTKNTGKALGVNVFKEVGLGRVFFGVGLTSILNSFTNNCASTTYSEQNSSIQITEHRDNLSIVFTSLLFIGLGFFTPLIKLFLCIPLTAFAGVLLLLFATVISSSIQQIAASPRVQSKKVLLIIATMVAINFVPFTIAGIAISSLAISVLVGIILNAIIPNRR